MLLFLIFFLLPRVVKNAPYVLAAILVGLLFVGRALFSGSSNVFHDLNAPVLFGSSYAIDFHPLLRLGPLFVSSTLIGSNEFGFRFAGFFAYLAW